MAKIYWNNLDSEIVQQIQDSFNGILTPDGVTITVDNNGVISAVAGTEYQLPTASTTVLGGVKVDGTTIEIDANGVITAIVDAPIDIVNDLTTGGVDKALSAEQGKALKALIDAIETYTLPTASTTVLGGVKVDGTSIQISADGVISTEIADLSLYIKTVNTTISPDAQGNIVLTAGDLNAYTKSEVDTKVQAVATTVDTHIQDGTVHITQAERDKLANIEAEANKYVLPIATDTVLGGVKQGTGVTITADGTLNVNAGETPKTKKFKAVTAVHATHGFIYTPSTPILDTDDLDVVFNGVDLAEGEWAIEEEEGVKVIVLNVEEATTIEHNNISGRIFRGFDSI